MKYLNKIIHGDVVEVLGKIPNNTVHLAITSPPYNVGKGYDSHNDHMNYEDYLNWLNNVWIEIKRILVPFPDSIRASPENSGAPRGGILVRCTHPRRRNFAFCSVWFCLC